MLILSCVHLCSFRVEPRVPFIPDPQWGLRVTEYRAYTVGSDGHFIGFKMLECADDAEAIEQATQLLGPHPIELWSGARLVTQLKPSE